MTGVRTALLHLSQSGMIVTTFQFTDASLFAGANVEPKRAFRRFEQVMLKSNIQEGRINQCE
jgi:hypothetical protein